MKTPEYRAKRAEQQRAWLAKPGNRAKHNERIRTRRANDPEHQAKRAEYDRARRATPEYRTKHAEHNRRWAYGLAPGERDAMFATQGYMCANQGCKATEPGSKVGWMTDHCHTTGRVRGILCYPCNVAAQKDKDCANRLRGLADYIDFHTKFGHYRYFAPSNN